MSKKIWNSPKAPAPVGPYSHAVEANGMLFISGQIPLDGESGKLVTSSIEQQTQKVMENLGHVLEVAGLSFKNIIKCNIFLTSMNDFNAVNEVYAKSFTDEPPARACVEVPRLPKDVNVEIEAIAVRDL